MGDERHLSLISRQQFGGLTVFHVLPIVGDADTQVLEGERTSKLPANPDDLLDLEFRYLDATLSLRRGHLYADRLVLSDQTQEWNGDNNYTEFPPEVGWPQEATPSTARYWASVQDEPGDTVLDGHFDGVGSSETDGQFESADFDLLVPDRVAGVLFVHVARIAVPSRDKLGEVTRRFYADQPRQVAVAVQRQGDRLIFESFK
jgi:hypothetical protein